jgi:hypothetical protein
MKLITGLTLMLMAVLAPLSAYADRTDEVQAPTVQRARVRLQATTAGHILRGAAWRGAVWRGAVYGSWVAIKA